MQSWPVLSLPSSLACVSDCAQNSALGESSTSSSVAGHSLTVPPRFSEFVSDEELFILSKGLKQGIPSGLSKSGKKARCIYIILLANCHQKL